MMFEKGRACHINLLPSQKRRGAVSRERGSRGRVGRNTVTL